MEDYAKTKIYFDGSHYIGIPHQKQPWKKRKNNKDVLQKKENEKKENKELSNKEIFEEVRKNGKYEIKIAKSDDKLINEEFMKTINDGIDLYKEYLENGVANKENLELINSLKALKMSSQGG